MKIIKLMLLSLVLCLSGCSSSADKEEKLSVKENSQIEATVENVPSDHIFQVKNKNLIIYENDKKTDLKFEKKDNSYQIMPPEEGYKEYCFYKIELKDNNSFNDKELQQYKTVIFYVNNEQQTKIAYQKNIHTDQQATIENKKLQSNQEYQKDDIVMIGKGENCQVVKINEKTADQQYSYEIPSLDDVYSSLQVNEHFINDFEHMEVNKAAVADYIRQQSSFQNVFPQSQNITANDISVQSKEDKDDGMILTVLIQQDGIKIALSYQSDHMMQQMAFVASSCQLHLDLSCDIEGDQAAELKKSISKDATKTELQTIYQQSKNDAINLDELIDLMDIRIPIQGPVSYYLDMNLKNEWVMPVNHENHSSLAVDAQLGYGIKNGKIYYQYADAKPTVHHDFQFSGTFKTNADLQIEMGLKLMNDQQLGMLFDTNVLGEGEGIFVIDSKKTGLGNLRLNGYWDAYLMISIFDQMMHSSMLNQSHETLWSWLDIDNANQLDSVNIASTYTADDGKIEIGQLQAIFKNILTDANNEMTLLDYELLIDGQQVEVTDGMVKIPESCLDKNCEISVRFEYGNEDYQYNRTVKIEQRAQAITSFAEAVAYLKTYLQEHDCYIPQCITADYEGNESYQEKGYLIHGYDDMGTHVATSFWYYVASDGKIYDMISQEYIN